MNTSLIQEALDDVGRSEAAITRAEDDLTSDIFRRLVDAVEKHDIVTNDARGTLLATALNISRAAVDWVSKGAGTGHVMPRHVLANFLAEPNNIAFISEKASATTAMQIETMVLKRLRQRNERDVVLERKDTAHRDGGTVYGNLPASVTTSGPMAEPVPAKKHPVIPAADYHSETTKHDGDLNGGRYPAKKAKR